MPTRVDPHVKVLDEQVVERAKERGLDAIVYAPHFQRLPAIRERAARFSDRELLVIPGREVFAGSWRNRRHVLAVAPERPIPDFITLSAAMEELAGQDAAVLVPHPGFLNVSLGGADVSEYAGEVDAVETYNPKQRAAGEAPVEAASETGTPAFGSSYAHLRTTVGEVWTEFEADLTSVESVVRAFRAGAPREVRHREGTGHVLRCVGELAHLGWENTWPKVDRVLLSGMEATHPYHVAYKGHFDDVAVY